ncbi:response regulator transcription factor [Roseovarius sp. D0-M9]|uniref:response regulator transcription factor n=1 Tax=Roseovarius sp. D0-M9 TaxID=3127117 RepID=UPI00300FEB10
MSSRFKLSELVPIIIIDDDDFFQVAIEKVLRSQFDVQTIVVCAAAEEAIAQLTSGTRFGLALVDLNMPGIDNKQLLDTLKAAQPDIRLVVLSASRAQEDILMALSAGAQGFINKGLGIGEMEAALQQITEGVVYVPPFPPQSDEPNVAPKTKLALVPLSTLTPRQLDVLRLIVVGQPNKGIAKALNISHSTVRFHISCIFQILGVSNRVEVATLGAQMLKENN